jgi:hypothetical protein
MNGTIYLLDGRLDPMAQWCYEKAAEALGYVLTVIGEEELNLDGGEEQALGILDGGVVDDPISAIQNIRSYHPDMPLVVLSPLAELCEAKEVLSQQCDYAAKSLIVSDVVRILSRNLPSPSTNG